MNEFPRLKININGFIKKNSFFNDEVRKNTLLSINKNSSFLKKIIEFKKKERSSSHKSVVNNNKIKKYYETITNKSISKIYQNAKYLNKLLIETKAEYPKRVNSKFIINLKKYSSQNENNSNLTNSSRVNYSINLKTLNNDDKSNFSINKKENYNPNTESRVFIFKGRKMFSPLLFYEKINNNTFNSIDNSSKLKENKSELFRNYCELNLKKEEIYKRKIMRNPSVENRNILKIQKDKEIKEQTLQNFKDRYHTKNLETLKRIKKIPKGNNYHKLKNKTKKNENKNDNYKEVKGNKIHELTRNNMNLINKNNLTSIDTTLRKNKNICFKNVISITNNRKKNIKINDNNFNNENKENYSQNCFNKKINSNISFFQNKSNSFVIDTNTKFPKKYLIENSGHESYFYTKDKKLTIKIHTLKNHNKFFPKKKIENLILVIQRFDIFIPKTKLMDKLKYNYNSSKIKEAGKK